MNFTPRTVPYQQTGYFSEIITEYLNGNEFLNSFFSHPVSYSGIEASIREREKFPTDRHLLVQVLKEQYGQLPMSDSVQQNLEWLEDKKTFTLTTAHQPAIFTGNLYFIYKILHVIKLAASCNARYPDKRFVPVFFMGSEDADLDELGHIYLDREKLNWETKQKGAVGRMQPAGLEKIIERIEGEFAGYLHGPELIRLLKDCYLDAENIQQATLKLLNSLFGIYGLIVLIPDNRLFKSAMRGIFKDDLTNHLPYKIIEQNILELSKHFNAQAKPRQINVFYLKEDIRERLEWKDGHYVVVHTSIRFTPEEMEKELANFPERFSPNVILRGIFQETILPNIAFIGGGGETAYWLELKPLFSHYRVPFPVLVLRNSFLLIKRNWHSKMNKAGLSAQTIFQPAESLVEAYVREHSANQLNLTELMTEMQQNYQRIKKVSGTVDKTLEQHVEKLSAQALQKLEELEKKILRAEKKNHEEVRNRIHKIKEALFPLNNLQERVDNFIPWFAEYGKSFFDVILQHALSLEQEFVILEEQN